MDASARFREYAAAFEDVVKSDDFSILEPSFTADAVYEISGGPPFAGHHHGRDAVFAHRKTSLDGFERRFATRSLEILKGPKLRSGSVWIHGRVSYGSPGFPELVLDGEGLATFEGDRISRLEDHFAPEMSSITELWFSRYGDQLARGD